MTPRNPCFIPAFLLLAFPLIAAAQPLKSWWPDDVEQQLVKAKANRGELEKALHGVPKDQRTGMVFIIANMPDADLATLSAEFLLTNHELAYKARLETAWGKDVPEAVFLNNVLPYANVDEKRDPWRKEMFEMCMPIVKDCKTPTEVAMKMNSELFRKLSLKYAPQRRSPNLSPKESIAQGNASCTGLSIVLSDACRSVGVPTRLVGTPNWSDKRGNHTWIEIWDKDWHFTGACEPDPNGLDRGWFVGDAAKAQKDVPEHAIYAVSYKKTELHFPLVWALNNKNVPGENVTDRYARKEAPRPVTMRLAIRVTDDNRKRIAAAVSVTSTDDAKAKVQGVSRDESADLNDYLTFDLPPAKEFVVKVGDTEKKITTGKAGELQVVDIVKPTIKSGDAITALKEALAANPKSPAAWRDRDFTRAPLTKSDAATARAMLWEAHVAMIKSERTQEYNDRVIKEDKLEMPFYFKTFGEKPKEGRSLWISLHGGGGAPKEVNDQQYQNQKRLYTLEEGIYLAPRAPTNTWNLWHEGHIDRMFSRLIEDLIVLEDVNPDRVYVMGYSAGGDGVYQLAPRMADHWAAAAMMAGHPNGVSLLSVRNVPFALQVGGNDAAYDRNKVAADYGRQLDALQKDDPKGYEHFVKIHEGKGHWMNLEDKAALPWMAKFSRNPVPERVVWKQTGAVHPRSYWLAVPKEEIAGGSLVIADRAGQTINLAKVEGVKHLHIRLDDRMLDTDQPVIVTHGGKELFHAVPARTIGTLLATLADRGDPKLVFDAEVSVTLAAAP
jgi:poly(3-hydroxybutyrate) depolymerase